MIFLNRDQSGSEKYLEWKVRLFLLGAALAMGGVGLDSSILIMLATLVLLGGVALRFMPAGRGPEGAADAEDDADDADADQGSNDNDVGGL